MKVFQNINERQKLCIVIFDEIYVKMAMLFRGGSVFGKAIHNPSKLAQSVLGITMVCLYGGAKFLVKMLPVANLNSEFVHDEINQTKKAIVSASGDVKVMVCDNNRVKGILKCLLLYQINLDLLKMGFFCYLILYI